MSKTDSEPKKAKIESKSDVSDNDVNDSEEDLTWEDVICLYCDQRVAITGTNLVRTRRNIKLIC